MLYDLEQKSKESSECFDITNVYFTQILSPELPEEHGLQIQKSV